MNNKTYAIVSYITIIGWLVAYFGGKDTADDFLKYHLRQSFGLFVCSFAFGIVMNIVVFILPALGLIGIIGIFFFALLIIGAINASNGQKKPLPVIGKFFEDKFSFIG